MLDGYLCGVLLQPERIAAPRWSRHVTDVDGRPLPASFEFSRLRALAERRHAELDEAIGRRRWFDPWVFELNDADDAVDVVGDSATTDAAEAKAAVYPWVAGFATALELFPGLMASAPEALIEPLALIYRHLDPDDLEDADALLEEIEALGPGIDLADAVEGLVRATLLLADITRP